ncbi:MAG: carboxypeptidase-like regulatory domain-containing protein, partial [Chitinophagales bacterium]|nr:carboxypeptidase-like regulatory domain-containing protein [Chitinophagales bacterium]
MKRILLFLSLFSTAHFVLSQTIIGKITDAQNNEPLIGANVVVKGTNNGTTTDEDGKFTLVLGNQKPPLTLSISYLGFISKDHIVSDIAKAVNIKLDADKVVLDEVKITASRLSEKAKQSPLTVESMDQIAIKQTPAFNFYEGLGQLKGVDITSASLGFKIINTRGFNSTSPVRSLQIIDGIDNQAPGLNFSLGN